MSIASLWSKIKLNRLIVVGSMMDGGGLVMILTESLLLEVVLLFGIFKSSSSEDADEFTSKDIIYELMNAIRVSIDV